MNKPVDALLASKMSRKEFLTTLGLFVVAASGFSNIVKLLTGKSAHGHINKLTVSESGYGGSAYGGGKD